MKNFAYGLLFIFAFVTLDLCAQKKSIYSRDNLIAWCVVPFDNMERTPAERAEMLKRLGFTKFAYDWRAKHVASLPEEITALKKNDVALSAVWIWIEPQTSGEVLDSLNTEIFRIVKSNNVKTDFWIGFSNNNFKDLNEEGKMAKAVSSVKDLEKRARDIGCTISLYNHGDWFGEPENMIRIIQNTGSKNVGIVYNFHHAHEQINAFPELLKKMLPYLRTVNINGMKADGPKILTVGEGNLESKMLQTLQASGFKGTVGIIGHTEGEDIEKVLHRNLQGLQSVLTSINDQQALRTFR